MLFDQAMDDGQSLSIRRSGIVPKGLENTGERFRRNSTACVDDAQINKAARASVRMTRQIILFDIDGRGADDKLAPRGHHVARVDCQVKNQLLDQAAVGSNRRQVRRAIEPDGDVFSEGALEQGAQARQDLVQIERLQARRVPATEVEQLSG